MNYKWISMRVGGSRYYMRYFKGRGLRLLSIIVSNRERFEASYIMNIY